MVTILNPSTGETKLVDDPTLRLAIGWVIAPEPSTGDTENTGQTSEPAQVKKPRPSGGKS